MLTNSQFGQHSWGQLKDGQSHRGHLEPGPGAEGEQPQVLMHISADHTTSLGLPMDPREPLTPPLHLLLLLWPTRAI